MTSGHPRSTLIAAMVLVAAIALCDRALATEREHMHAAAESAAKHAISQAIETGQFPLDKSIAVCPFWADRKGVDADYIDSPCYVWYVKDVVEEALVQKKYTVVVRDRKEWAPILEEFEFAYKREDVMDSSTVQRFGRILGAGVLVYGTVREWNLSVESTRALAHISLKAAEVETGKVIGAATARAESFPPWIDLLRRFWFVVVGVLGLIVLLLILWRMKRAFRRAMRPR